MLKNIIDYWDQNIKIDETNAHSNWNGNENKENGQAKQHLVLFDTIRASKKIMLFP